MSIYNLTVARKIGDVFRETSPIVSGHCSLRLDGRIISERAADDQIGDVLPTNLVGPALDLSFEGLHPIFPHLGQLIDEFLDLLDLLSRHGLQQAPGLDSLRISPCQIRVGGTIPPALQRRDGKDTAYLFHGYLHLFAS